MPHYVGLDVSQKTTAICVVDEKGKRLWRGVCTTGPEPISDRISKHAGRILVLMPLGRVQTCVRPVQRGTHGRWP
jgi:transposase